MKQQVVVIHGGTTFSSHEDFLAYLKHKPVELDDLRPYHGWKASLQHALGEGFDVLLPSMPNKQNAAYDEWSTWFETMLPLFNDDVILIGHSMGGVFLAKYLSEHQLPKKIKATILVAAPMSGTREETLGSFQPPTSMERLTKQGGVIHLWYSEDDMVVPVDHLEQYKALLPSAVVHKLNGYGHFRAEQFPELVECIKKLI